MKFSYSKIEMDCNEMQLIVNKIKENLDVIRSVKEQIAKNSVWQGQACDSYVAKFNQIVSEFEAIHFELTNDTNYLKAQLNKYKNLDNDIIAAVTNAFSLGK